METIDGHRALKTARSPAVALGNFDGVHLGHRALLRSAIDAAAARGGQSVVYTFDPHPAKVLAPDRAPKLITTRARKLELFAEAGIDVCVVEPFSRELSELSPAQFVDDILAGALRAEHVTVGYDFSFGKSRAGSVELLRAMCPERFELTVIDPVTIDGVCASSSKIRELVVAGDVGGARALLGRDFDVDGPVIEGARRGRELGVPTANVAADTELLPAAGIYAGRVMILDEGTWLDAAISLGTNPTFVDGQALSLEAHILDFDRDIYGQRVRVAFTERLRGEEKFDGVDALMAQIQRDIEQSRQILRQAK